jgi:hypothetical protein
MRIIFLLLIILGLSSCGKSLNSPVGREAFSQNLAFTLMEHQCVNDASVPSELFKNITLLLQNAVNNNPAQLYSTGVPLLFDFLHPMVVSLAGLQNEYNLIAANPAIHSIDQILNLYNKAQRFEDLRCSLNGLAEKQKNDIRPFYNLFHTCLKENINGDCSENEYANNPLVSNDILSLCEAFYTKAHCQAEFNLSHKENNLTALVEKYRQRFSDEKIDTLFRLKTDHLSFVCQKENAPSAGTLATTMTIPVFAPSMDQVLLKNLLSNAERVWNSERLKLKFEIVTSASAQAVEVISITRGISHVFNEDSHKIYLNSSLPNDQIARVFAHEFGHVLGFPDCYIEFFDTSKKELVYYEIAERNTNIMCSMKSSVRVPADYFVQLEQSSCLFR